MQPYEKGLIILERTVEEKINGNNEMIKIYTKRTSQNES